MCKGKNCTGGYDCCGCKVRITDNCVTINKDLPNINVLKGELLSATLLKIDGKFENPLTVTTVGASGATTLASGNLNVPRYDLGFAQIEEEILDQLELTTTTSIVITAEETVNLVVANRKAYYGVTGVGSNLLSLPPIAGNTSKEFIIANKSDDAITLYSNNGVSLDIWEQGTPTDEKIITLGTTITLFNDGVHWVVTSEY